MFKQMKVLATYENGKLVSLQIENSIFLKPTWLWAFIYGIPPTAS